jgi:hypothetical protein
MRSFRAQRGHSVNVSGFKASKERCGGRADSERQNLGVPSGVRYGNL